QQRPGSRPSRAKRIAPPPHRSNWSSCPASTPKFGPFPPGRWAGPGGAPILMPMDPAAPHSPHARPLRDPQLPVGYGGGGAPLVDSMTAQERPRFTRRGNPIVPPDPGTPGSRLLAILAAVLLAGIVIVWQNMGPDRQQDLINAPPTPPAA